MKICKWWMPSLLVGAMAAGSACTQKAADETTITVDTPEGAGDRALDATREGAAAIAEGAKEAGEATAEGAGNVAQEAGDKTKEIAGAVGSKTKEIVTTTGEAITDGWITTKVSATFVDEALLKGSNINVDTQDHVVTLNGTVGSEAAKARAAEIARSTEGVTRVVNQLVVK